MQRIVWGNYLWDSSFTRVSNVPARVTYTDTTYADKTMERSLFLHRADKVYRW
jgi:hypothetical protein